MAKKQTRKSISASCHFFDRFKQSSPCLAICRVHWTGQRMTAGAWFSSSSLSRRR